MIIDFHTHIALSKLYPDYFINGIVESLANKFKQVNNREIDKRIIQNLLLRKLNDDECLMLLDEMNKASITKSVLLIPDFSYNRSDIELSLEEIYEYYHNILCIHEDRFIVFAGIDPRREEEGLKLLDKSIKDYNFKGLKLYPPCGFNLKDEVLNPFYELCDHYSLPVLTHTGPSLDGMYLNNDTVEDIKSISQRFKNIKIILAHGLRHINQNIDLLLEEENIYMDVSAFQENIADHEKVSDDIYLLARKVPDKVLFGTDWPMFSMSGEQKAWVDFFLNNEKLDKTFIDKLMFKNAINVLNIK